jgi:putative transposase
VIPGRPKRLRAFPYVGAYRYFLTLCTFRRTRVFVTNDRVALVLEQIQRAAATHEFAILAYCFMPDHLHFLVEGQSEASGLKEFARLAKQYSGYHYRRRYGSPLWQSNLYEHVARDDERTDAMVRYIVENPVRAQLVQRVQDYPFVGSCVVGRAELLASLGDPDHGPT